MKLYYSRKACGDVLLIVIDDNAFPDEVIKNDNVVALYKNKQLIGVNIFDFSKISRIFIEGEIEGPSLEFIKLVNHILRNAHVEPLKEE
ncbi:MAG: DUF4479 domain-containing protein [Bacilli bacterium]|nr:DUF4479 domain-containing protein [Bacilli bacterium]